jgi:acylphosphatase
MSRLKPQTPAAGYNRQHRNRAFVSSHTARDKHCAPDNGDSHPHNSVRIEALVRGRVQMVMFRDFVQRHAKKLGLSGWVQNEQDGTVRVVAQGERTAIEQLLARLHTGPLFARVDDVAVIYTDTRPEPLPFIIRYH